MRVLAFFLHRYSEYGNMLYGSDRRFFELSKYLRNLGLKIFALEYEPSLIRSLKHAGYYPVEVSRKFRDHTILNIIRFTVYGIKLCIKYKIELVYSVDHFVLENVVSAFLVSRLCRKPLAIVFHHLARAHQMSFSAVFRGEFDRSELNPFSLVVGAFLTSLKHFIYRRAEVCVAVSQATANDLKKNFGLKRVAVTRNGVNLRRYETVKSRSELYEAAYLGRVTSTKGVDILLKSWKIVTTRLPSARLLIIGGFEKDWLKSHKKTVQKLALESNVIMTGFVSDDEAIKLLKSSKIFVLPSIEEGFGLAVLEAMACGLPCILSDIPALKENFGSAAVFVNPKDINGLASSILTLLFDSQKRNYLSRRGLEVVKRFTWERVAERELEALRDVSSDK